MNRRMTRRMIRRTIRKMNVLTRRGRIRTSSSKVSRSTPINDTRAPLHHRPELRHARKRSGNAACAALNVRHTRAEFLQEQPQLRMLAVDTTQARLKPLQANRKPRNGVLLPGSTRRSSTHSSKSRRSSSRGCDLSPAAVTPGLTRPHGSAFLRNHSHRFNQRMGMAHPWRAIALSLYPAARVGCIITSLHANQVHSKTSKA